MEERALKIGADNQNLQFKLLSAIGIIIIVSGHCYRGGISLAYEWFPIYSFNVSLFVFISGYFYKPEYERSVFKYICKRFKRLVIPAYLWNIAYGLFILLMKNLGYTIGAKVNLYNLFVMPFVDGEAFQYNLGSWFVYPLFLSCVFNVLFCRATGLLKIRNDLIILALYSAVGIFGIQLAIGGHNTGVMKLITRTMMFLPWLQAGRFYNSWLEKRDKLNSAVYFAVLFAVQLLLLTFFDNLEYAPSAMSAFDNGSVVPYITSFTGIAFWLRVSKLLVPMIKDNKIVKLISDNTYSIMIHQMLGFMFVKWLFYALSLMTNWFPDFNAQFMRSSIWYYYIPKGLQQYGMLYLAAGLFIPIGIKRLCDMCYGAMLALKGRVTQRLESGGDHR